MRVLVVCFSCAAVYVSLLDVLVPATRNGHIAHAGINRVGAHVYLARSAGPPDRFLARVQAHHIVVAYSERFWPFTCYGKTTCVKHGIGSMPCTVALRLSGSVVRHQQRAL